MPALDDAAHEDAPFDFDLRISLPFISSRLEVGCGVDRERPNLAVLAIEDGAVARALSAAVLRFCPACLQAGFHATLHQCLLLDLCPLHHKRLRSRCPACRSRIAYRFDSLAATHPYACPHCDALLVPALAQPAGRPARLPQEQHDYLIATQRLVERHGNCLSMPPRPFGVSAKKHATPLRARLSYLRRLIQPGGVEGNPGTDDVRAARRLAARWLAAAPQTKPAAILGYREHHWPTFCGIFRRLEWDYRRAVAALQARIRENEMLLVLTPSTHAIGLGDLATTLFRMTWEGVHNSDRLNQSTHPAFGIAVWLALVDLPVDHSTRDTQSICLCFHDALETVLASAIVWARRMRVAKTPVQTGRLLLPEIFDLARSQRFDNRNL
jgi:hypothetical protein